jgi:succinylglutamate desuccinylase
MGYSRNFFSMDADQKIHYDLHTAIRGSVYKQFAISPNSSDRAETEQQCLLLGQYGIEAILTTTQKSATFSAFTANILGATSFTLELGSAKPFGENNITEFAAIIEGLHGMISGKLALEVGRKKAKRFIVAAEVPKKTDAFRLLFASDIVNFTPFNEGDVLAADKDYQYIVTKSGERILFPNENVAIGQRALVIVRPDENYTENT